ncbi:unnamed protein product [Clonostachys rosea f. rosea IK726]|uniref:Uncharacterized protein n=1 Tax=Clonostachys rosea f. rosea IK726 TaxID=1349383 RepID=A0ACA9U387_BIOOC|nr:unnamed protein product [Clonostachys rosea f. rosea IK726]
MAEETKAEAQEPRAKSQSPTQQPSAAGPLSSKSPSKSPQGATLPPEPTGHLEAEEEGAISDEGSDLGADDVQSSTASLSSTIYKFREENGRTYHAHKDGAYVAPNDQLEQERLDFQHALCLLTFDNRLYFAPLDQQPLRRVLDVGTGTGCWAIDFADDHPSATVVGIDLSPIQPSLVPPNVEFQVDDLEDDWTFSEPFDYIYTRFMTVSFANWPRFFEQSMQHTTPGGWLEVVDILPPISDDGTMSPDTALYKWSNYLLEGTEKIGRPFGGTAKYKEQMQEAGYQNVVQHVYKWPQNRWPKDPKYKELGKSMTQHQCTWTLENISSGLDAISSALFTRVLGWTKPELDVFLVQVRKDIKNPAIHAYWPIYVIYGQKPK